MRPSENHKLDVPLFCWFIQVCDKGFLISEPVLQEKAMSLNKAMREDQNFAASLGWFRQQEETVWSSTNSAFVERNFLLTWLRWNGSKAKFWILWKKKGLTPDQICNCDETGLNFKLMPRNTLAWSSEKNSDNFKTSKERNATFWLLLMHQDLINYHSWWL